MLTHVKVIPKEEVSLQHQFLVCDMQKVMPILPRLKVQEVFKEHMLSSESEAGSTAEEVWANLKTGLLKTTGEVCSTTCPHRWPRETWWWSDKVKGAIAAKGHAKHGRPTQEHKGDLQQGQMHCKTQIEPCLPGCRQGGLREY